MANHNMRDHYRMALSKDARFNEKMKERQADLLKFYKHIVICKNKRCGMRFGRDTKTRYANGFCPLCQIEIGLGGSSKWDRHRDRIKQKQDSGSSGKARRGLNG